MAASDPSCLPFTPIPYQADRLLTQSQKAQYATLLDIRCMNIWRRFKNELNYPMNRETLVRDLTTGGRFRIELRWSITADDNEPLSRFFIKYAVCHGALGMELYLPIATEDLKIILSALKRMDLPQKYKEPLEIKFNNYATPVPTHGHIMHSWEKVEASRVEASRPFQKLIDDLDLYQEEKAEEALKEDESGYPDAIRVGVSVQE